MNPYRLFSFRTILIGLVALSIHCGAWAITVLSSTANVDNGFVIYISTSDNTTGTQFSSGNNWSSSVTGTVNLNAGQDYYLHVYAYDQGGIAGFLGQFSLSGTGHVFANGSTTLLTETTDWKGNSTGFNGSYGALTDLGANGIGPWGFQSAVSSSAHWIWVGDANANDYSYLSTKITATGPAVPEPATMLLLGVGLAGMGWRRRLR